MKQENVRFEFLSEGSGCEQLRGVVVIDPGVMTLDIADPANDDHYVVVGREVGPHFEGNDTSPAQRERPIRAEWVRLRGRYVGFWSQAGYEYYFSFSLLTE